MSAAELVFCFFVLKGFRGNVFFSAFFMVLDIFFLSAETWKIIAGYKTICTKFVMIYNVNFKAPTRSEHCNTTYCNIGPGFCKPRQDKWSQHFSGTYCNNVCACLTTLKIELVHMPRNNIVAQTRPNDFNIMHRPQIIHEKFDYLDGKVRMEGREASSDIISAVVRCKKWWMKK